MHALTRRGVATLHTGRGKKPKNRQVVTPREQRGCCHFQPSTNFNKFNVITQNEWNVLLQSAGGINENCYLFF